MSDWGLPDWTKLEQYPFSAKTTRRRWKWEFLRRRDDVRIVFDEWAERAHIERLRRETGAIPKSPIFRPDEPGFTTSPYGGDAFGYKGDRKSTRLNSSHG